MSKETGETGFGLQSAGTAFLVIPFIVINSEPEDNRENSSNNMSQPLRTVS